MKLKSSDLLFWSFHYVLWVHATLSLMLPGENHGCNDPILEMGRQGLREMLGHYYPQRGPRFEAIVLTHIETTIPSFF